VYSKIGAAQNFFQMTCARFSLKRKRVNIQYNYSYKRSINYKTKWTINIADAFEVEKKLKILTDVTKQMKNRSFTHAK
jgi:hypothetical protein